MIKRTFLYLMLVSPLLFPQLKEMEVKPTENRGGIPIFRDYPDKAGIIIYAQFNDLSFYSSYGIVKVMDESGGKFIVIIEPVKQTLEVRAPGFKTEMIKLTDLQPRDVKYYEVLPKKEEGIGGVTEVGVTIQVSPSDASITLDGSSFPNNVTTKVLLGNHNLRVEKAGYGSSIQEIIVTPEKTLFQINLEKVSLSPVTIKSNPSNATVYINNEQKGTTEVGLFLYSGSYELRIELNDYLPIIQTIQVSSTTDKTKNIFTYNLFRNKGTLELSVTPSNANVSLNNEQRNISGSLELTPGLYDLEVKASLYDTYKEQIEIKRGETLKKVVNLTKNTGVLELKIQPTFAIVNINKAQKSGNRFELNPGVYEIEIAAETFYSEIFTVNIEKGKTIERTVNLKQKTGTLQFTIKPLNTKVVLTLNGIEKYSWEGINIIDNIPEGVYDLSAKASGFKSYTGKVTIKENQSKVEDIQMTPGSDSPEGMVVVEGNSSVKSFMIGKTEVKQALWESVMGINPSYFKGSNRPVEKVSWYDVVEFCNKLSEKEGLQKAYSGSRDNITCNFNSSGYRLPTEAEWEYAASGGNKSKGYEYSGSNDTDAVAWYTSNSGSNTHEVGTKQANELGIYDMSGNVWEWCWDISSGSNRVLRGGSWGNFAGYCRVADRLSNDPDSRVSSLGFRLARTK